MKKIKRLRRRVLEQIKTSGGVPRKRWQLREDLRLEEAQRHFLETERSLVRVQAALSAWAGAMDALSCCTQAVAEELARHTILVTRPSDPNAPGGNENAKFCHALQEIMTATETSAKPVHDVLLQALLQPSLEITASDIRKMHSLLEDRKKKLEASTGYRKKSHVNDPEEKFNDLDADYGFRLGAEDRKEERALTAQQALHDSTQGFIESYEEFREGQIERLPHDIGMFLGCYYGFTNRVNERLAELLPEFPHAACAAVDVAHASTLTKQRLQRRNLLKIEGRATNCAAGAVSSCTNRKDNHKENCASAPNEKEKRMRRHRSYNVEAKNSKSQLVSKKPSLNTSGHTFSMKMKSVGTPRSISSRLSFGISRSKSKASVVSSTSGGTSSLCQVVLDDRVLREQEGLRMQTLRSLKAKLGVSDSEEDDEEDDDLSTNGSWKSDPKQEKFAISVVQVVQHDHEYHSPISNSASSNFFFPEVTYPRRVPAEHHQDGSKKTATSLGFATLHEQFRSE